MIPYLDYFLILIGSALISLAILKWVIMKLTDFYDYINITIFIFLIFLIFVLFSPKLIDKYPEKLSPTISCNCLGFKTLISKDFRKETYCYGIKFSCLTVEQFKKTASSNNLACDKKNDFYISKDSCLYDIAKLIAGNSVNEDKDFNYAFETCNRVDSNFLKESCNNYVTTLKNGGVVFSKP